MPVPLADVLDSYIVSHSLVKTSCDQLRATLRLFDLFLKRPATIDDFRDDTVNRWIDWLLDGRSRATVHGRRISLLTLWRACFQDGTIDQLPRRVKRVNVPTTLPEAWSMTQLRLLLQMASKIAGRFKRSQVNRAAFWRAFILFTYDTALRLGDVLALRSDQIDERGNVVIVQSKTGRAVLHRLYPETMAAIEMIRSPDRPLLFGSCYSRKRVMQGFKKLVESAGLRGGSKKIRKTSATAIERVHPGSASRHLGHRTPGIAAKHYIDPRLLDVDRPRPPEIC